MMKKTTPSGAPPESQTLNEKHHAVLFALVSRQVILRYGFEIGQVIVRKVVRRYGEQRGRRMALRAMRDGKTLSMDYYLKYGEWESKTREGMAETMAVNTDVVSHVLRCPWNNAWVESDLLPYGRLYCLEIDHALVRGFNPDLEISVNQTLSNDDSPCEFIYHQAALGREAIIDANERVMPWVYHCAHLLAAFDEILKQEFGEQSREVIQMGVDGFNERFNSNLEELLGEYRLQDFNQLPD